MSAHRSMTQDREQQSLFFMDGINQNTVEHQPFRGLSMITCPPGCIADGQEQQPGGHFKYSQQVQRAGPLQPASQPTGVVDETPTRSPTQQRIQNQAISLQASPSVASTATHNRSQHSSQHRAAPSQPVTTVVSKPKQSQVQQPVQNQASQRKNLSSPAPGHGLSAAPPHSIPRGGRVGNDLCSGGSRYAHRATGPAQYEGFHSPVPLNTMNLTWQNPAPYSLPPDQANANAQRAPLHPPNVPSIPPPEAEGQSPSGDDNISESASVDDVNLRNAGSQRGDTSSLAVGPGAIPASLPLGWQTCLDPCSRRRYYRYDPTGTWQWELPRFPTPASTRDLSRGRPSHLRPTNQAGQRTSRHDPDAQVQSPASPLVPGIPPSSRNKNSLGPSEVDEVDL
jgi:hypothetical protein